MTSTRNPIGAPHRTESRIGRATWRLITALIEENPLATEAEIARRLQISKKTVHRYLCDFGQQVPTSQHDVLVADGSRDHDPMATKRLLVPMPDDLFARLEKSAESADRDASQQARALLRQALEVEVTEATAPGAAQAHS